MRVNQRALASTSRSVDRARLGHAGLSAGHYRTRAARWGKNFSGNWDAERNFTHSLDLLHRPAAEWPLQFVTFPAPLRGKPVWRSRASRQSFEGFRFDW